MRTWNVSRRPDISKYVGSVLTCAEEGDTLAPKATVSTVFPVTVDLLIFLR